MGAIGAIVGAMIQERMGQKKGPTPTPPSEWMSKADMARLLGFSKTHMGRLAREFAEVNEAGVIRHAGGKISSLHALQFLDWWVHRPDMRYKSSK